MTQLRKAMLEELQCRNLSPITTRTYLRAVAGECRLRLQSGRWSAGRVRRGRNLRGSCALAPRKQASTVSAKAFISEQGPAVHSWILWLPGSEMVAARRTVIQPIFLSFYTIFTIVPAHL